VYEKYGGLLMNTAGMTAEGVERKATCRALFQKMLALTECEWLVTQGSEAAQAVSLREVRPPTAPQAPTHCQSAVAASQSVGCSAASLSVSHVGSYQSLGLFTQRCTGSL
jgi:hypothetical protein